MNTNETNNKSVPPESAAANDALRPINIWLVDDNQPLRATLTEILSNCAGMRCTGSFHSPNAVLSALASKAGPDVILLDIQMGDACGLDAIRPIKSLSRTTQVLMFSSCFDSKSKERAFDAGASDFLLKRFPIEHIVSSIRHAAENPVPAPRRRKTKSAPPPVVIAPAVSPEKHPSWMKSCLSLLRARWN